MFLLECFQNNVRFFLIQEMAFLLLHSYVLPLHVYHQHIVEPALNQPNHSLNLLNFTKFVTATEHIEDYGLASIQGLTQLFKLISWIRKYTFFFGDSKGVAEVIKKVAWRAGN